MLVNAPDTAKLFHGLPALADLPHATQPAETIDSMYPTLTWQLPAVKQALRRMMEAGGWLQMRLNASRYAHLPLSAFSADWITDTCDALYARQLRDAGYVLLLTVLLFFKYFFNWYK